MAAGEDETQPVIVHRHGLVSHRSFLCGCRRLPGQLFDQLSTASRSAQQVDPTVAGRRDDPAGRVGRSAGGGPPLTGDDEGVLDGVLGK
jgi:hypothetical protein